MMVLSRSKLRKLINILLVIAVAGSWVAVLFFSSGALITNGLGSMKYFTVLSNLFEGAASAIWLVSSRRHGKANAGKNGTVNDGTNGTASDRAERLKYVAAAAVGLTFTTVMCFLGPLYGYPAMFVGGNLFMHLITPVAAVAEIIFLSDFRYTRRDNKLVIIPPLLYGIVYLCNNLINGIGEWPDTNDWYLFLAWGYPVGIIIFAVICAVTWLLGLAMRKLHRN